MQATAGHPWFSETRAGLMGHIPRGGIRQSALIERVATTKQAVQQILDGLEAEGIVERIADPADGRGKYVRYTGARAAGAARRRPHQARDREALRAQDRH